MKFLCLDCDDVMAFAERQIPGDGTLAAVFACPSCGREMAMLTNPMETQLVSSMGVKIGGREVPEQPLEMIRSSLEGGSEEVFADPPEERGPAASGEREAGASESRGPAASGEREAGASESRGPATLGEREAGASEQPAAGAGAGAAGAEPRVSWTPEALDRLERVPRFVRGMVKRIYTDYAKENAIGHVTPDVMDRARSELGLEGM